MILAIVLSAVLLALVLVLGLVLPSIADPMVPFGVRVPAQHASDPEVQRQTRLYRWRVLGSGIVSAAAGLGLYALTGEPLMLPLSVLLLVGAWYGCFVVAHAGIRTAKLAGGWFEGVRQGIAVDTTLRTDPPRFPWLWLLPAVVLTAVTIVVGVVAYPTMPHVLEVHYNASGVPNRQAVKSVGTAFSLVFVQIGVTGVLVGIAAAIFHSRADIDPARPAATARWFRQYMVLGAKALLALSAAIDLGMLAASLLMWSGTVTVWAPLAIVIPVMAGVLVTVVVLAKHNRTAELQSEGTGLTHSDDDALWRGGLFYINRSDHALFVARRYGIGWTVNFGNPQAAMLLAALIAVIALAVILRFGG